MGSEESEYNFERLTEKTREKKELSLRVKLTNSKEKDLKSAIRQHFWSSEEEHRADALALGADEGRDKLR